MDTKTKVNIKNWVQRDREIIWHPYTQERTAAPPLPIVKGEGTLLYDDQGNTYIDAVASWWVNIHGHAHPYIAKKVYEQLMTLEQVIFAGFTHQPAVQLAERLLKILPENQARIFFSDNGSTAVEIGLKMALQYFHNQGIKRHRIITFNNAFHGETFGAMSVSGELSLNNAYEKFLFEVSRIPVPFDHNLEASISALKKELATGDVAAFLFEPLIQGAGGMRMYPAAHLDKLIELCQEAGVICIADEVMTGFGRTGTYFASNQLHHQPDILSFAKGLTGGTLPLAITTCNEKIYDAFLSEDKYKTFFHGHSFTANPVGCAASLASLDLLESAECQKAILDIGLSHKVFADTITDHPMVKDVRQQGTIMAIEFITNQDSGYFNNIRDQLYHFFLERGILLRPLGNVIYLMPPYCMTNTELQKVYQAIREALDFFLGKNE